jgi:NADH-quinone oxidoreductase subunit N
VIALATASFAAPHIEYGDLSPILILLGVATLGILIEVFVPRSLRFVTQAAVAGAGVIAAAGATIAVWSILDPGASHPKPGKVVAEGAFALDGPSLIGWSLILVLALLGIFLFAERRLEGGVSAFAGQAATVPGSGAERESAGLEHGEVFPLMMFSVAGMLMFVAANDLIVAFVALEILSLPLYLLCALARRRRLLSQEAAMKYFLLGAFSSGFFVYGMALTYGFAGSMGYAQIATAVQGRTGAHALLLGGMGLLAVGLFFKIGAVPFHGWVPDVYQGAPTAVTGFMAAATKVAAFCALLRLFFVAFGSARWDWEPMFWVIAIATMVIGAVLALSQRDVKRLLAYSSIAHAGFLLVGLLGARALSDGPGQIQPVQAVLFYLTSYGFMTIAAFAIATLVRDASGEATSFASWRGLGKASPVVASLFAFLVLAMAGVPLTAGFTGKWAVFTAAVAAGSWQLMVIAVFASAVALAFYIRVIVVMFFSDPVDGVAETSAAAVTVPSPLTAAVIGLGVSATVVLGVVPGPFLDLLGRVGVFVR